LNIHELEKNLIPSEQWDDDPSWREVVPEDIQKEMVANPPTAAFGLGHDDQLGWYVLSTQGQGGGIVWHEKDPSKQAKPEDTSQELWSQAAAQWRSARASWVVARHSHKPMDRDLAMSYEAHARALECQARAAEADPGAGEKI